MDNKIEISKDGVKMNYARFIGGSSIGFIFILFSWACFTFPQIFMPGIEKWVSSFTFDAPSEISIFLLLLLFLLSSALGGMIDAANWFFGYSWIQICLGRLTLKNAISNKNNLFVKMLLRITPTYYRLNLKESLAFFCINEKNYRKFFRYLKFVFYEVDEGNFSQYIRGQATFFRNLGFIFLVAATLDFSMGGFCHSFIYFGLVFVCILLNLSEDFYISCKAFEEAYLLCLPYSKKNDFIGDEYHKIKVFDEIRIKRRNIENGIIENDKVRDEHKEQDLKLIF